MKVTSQKDKLEKDYEKFNKKVESAAKLELKKIQEQTQAIKAEAEKIGETVESTVPEISRKSERKKV